MAEVNLTNTQRAVGRRKSSVAVVNIRKGNGKILVNKIMHNRYFFDPLLVKNMELPLTVTKLNAEYDVDVKVVGGGISGQSDAVKLGIARALVKADAELKKVLRDNGCITRDARSKERKKFGKYGARRSPQFTKR